MILFCDTSALVKLYIVEAGSEELKARVLKAEVVAVCRIAWAEAYAALSRRAREVPEDTLVIEQAKAALAADWPHFVVLKLTNRWLNVRENLLIRLHYAAMTASSSQPLLKLAAFRSLPYSLLALIYA